MPEGTHLSVTGSHVWYCPLRRENLCRFDINQSFDNVGFPLKIDIVVEQLPSSLSTPYFITHDLTEKTFWIPYDDIFSNNARHIISRIVFLINIPFSLDSKLKWRGLRVRDLNFYTYFEKATMLENRDTLIYKIVEFARSMKDRPSLVSDKDWSMALTIKKVTYLPDMEFEENYKKMEPHYNFEVWRKTQKELDSRIETLQALQKEVVINKMRFEAGASKHSTSFDMCSICMEEFSAGSTISCLKHCSHVYHETCILDWLLRNRSCPYCRSYN